MRRIIILTTKSGEKQVFSSLKTLFASHEKFNVRSIGEYFRAGKKFERDGDVVERFKVN